MITETAQWPRIRKQTIQQSDTSRWFPVSVDRLRNGDYIRFRGTGYRGRYFEGPVKKLDDGTFWCDFNVLTSRTHPKSQTEGYGLERLGVPALNDEAMKLLDGVALMTRTDLMVAALTSTSTSGELFDQLMVEARTHPWWGIWEYGRKAVEARARELGPETARMTAGACDVLCAALVATALADKIAPGVQINLMRGFRRAQKAIQSAQ